VNHPLTTDTSVAEGNDPPGSAAGRPSRNRARPIGNWAFLGVVVTSLGGPLALGALYAPSIVADASASSGLATLAAAVVFSAPLIIWVRFARQISSSGGLYSFVEAAAGRRAARLQAGLWIASYLLYLLYTTASIVYDTLPAVLPGIHPYQPALEIAIPLALAGIMLAGRTVALATIGTLAVGQLTLLGVLAELTTTHDAPISSFQLGAPSGSLATATGQTALLYVCGSLPLFLGGEVARPARTVPRGLVAGALLVAAGVVVAVFPLAANPAFARAPIPGMSIAEQFAGHRLAVVIGVGVAASIGGVMLVEYLALSRLLHAVTGRSVRSITGLLAVALVAVAPISLINPDRFYSALLKPSLVALWLSQLTVFAVYPRFAIRRGARPVPTWTLAAVAMAFAGYGVWATLHHTTT
jgi:amino acid transporter